MDEARAETWFTDLADELAQVVLDAGECARACEELLEAGRREVRPGQQRLLAAIAPPAAVCSVLVDLLDRPPELIIAAAAACRETSLAALDRLDPLASPLDPSPAAAALGRVAESCGRLLDAAGRP